MDKLDFQFFLEKRDYPQHECYKSICILIRHHNFFHILRDFFHLCNQNIGRNRRHHQELVISQKPAWNNKQQSNLTKPTYIKSRLLYSF